MTFSHLRKIITFRFTCSYLLSPEHLDKSLNSNCIEVTSLIVLSWPYFGACAIIVYKLTPEYGIPDGELNAGINLFPKSICPESDFASNNPITKSFNNFKCYKPWTGTFRHHSGEMYSFQACLAAATTARCRLLVGPLNCFRIALLAPLNGGNDRITAINIPSAKMLIINCWSTASWFQYRKED